MRELSSQVAAVQTAHQFSNWTVKIVSKGSQFSQGAAAFAPGEVRIMCDTEQPVSLAAFELENLKNHERFARLWKDALAGVLNDRDLYAKNAEWIEYGSLRDQNMRMATCRSEQNWGEGVTLKTRRYATFWPTYWMKIIFDDHANWHRSVFDKGHSRHGEGVVSTLFDDLTDIFFTFLDPMRGLRY